MLEMFQSVRLLDITQEPANEKISFLANRSLNTADLGTALSDMTTTT